MATLEQLEQALIAADAAGNEQDARVLAQAVADARRQAPQAKPTREQYRTSLRDKIIGGAEVAATMGSAIAAEPAAGWAGIGAMLPGGRTPTEAIQDTRQAMTYQPRTETGQRYMGNVAEAIQPLAEAVQGAEEATGEIGYRVGGPVGGAAGQLVPTLAAEAIGLGLGRGAGRVGRTLRAQPDDAAQKLLKASDEFDVPVMTTDAIPPKTYGGRFLRGLSEKLGPLGTGQARVTQQAKREAALKGFVEQMDIDIDSPFAEGMVQSIKSDVARRLSQAGELRSSAVRKLDPAGPVPLTKTKQVIREQIARQQRLKDRADTATIQKLEDTLSSLDDANFSLAKDIRTEVIDDVKSLLRGEDSRAVPSFQAVKKAMDDDLLDFAKSVDRDAAADWVRSNRIFADAYSQAKDTELKRIIKSGDVTPEKVLPILRGGKPSELTRLARNMGEDGRAAARQAIIQDALKKAKYFETDTNPNPDAFATAMNRPNVQQAVNVFYGPRGREQIDGLVRLLDNTREAQRSAAMPKTGEQMIPMGAAGALGAGVAMAPTTTLSVAGTLALALKAYESKPFRTLLLKLANTPKGTPAEKALLDRAMTGLVGGYVASTRPQEQREQPAEELPQ